MCAERTADWHRGSALGLSQRAEAPTALMEACPPLEHFPASWALFCPTFEERAELLRSSWPTTLQSCPHRPPLHWDLTCTFLVPAPSKGVWGPLQLCHQGKQNHFVLSWRGSCVGRILISSSDTQSLRRPGLTASMWAAVGPCLLSAPLLTGWSVFWLLGTLCSWVEYLL